MEHVERLLSDYLDGELSHEAAQQVEAHLAACATCARRFRSLRRTVRFIQSNGRVPIEPASAAGAMARFNQAVMQPGSSEADVERVLAEEGWRFLPDGGPAAERG
ncbi:MAG TPA: zf-HC2 domain-containing protein [Dehalococcoidia bacterium]|jgi:anti-sigma factor RsiW